MNIFQLNQILLEYNKSGKLTTLAGQGGDKAAGKNFDNIIAGKASPYKTTEYEVQYAKLFPHLAQLVKKIKSRLIKIQFHLR